MLSTQELADLRLPRRERLLEQVMGNLSVLIAHRQVVPSSGELIAGLAGVRGAWRTSRHSGGRTTRVRTREPILRAEHVMSLERGSAAVIVLDNGGVTRLARMLSPRQRPVCDRGRLQVAARTLGAPTRALRVVAGALRRCTPTRRSRRARAAEREARPARRQQREEGRR